MLTSRSLGFPTDARTGKRWAGRDTPANDIRRESPLVFAHRVNFSTLTADIPSALHSVMNFFHSELCVDISKVDNVLSNLTWLDKMIQLQTQMEESCKTPKTVLSECSSDTASTYSRYNEFYPTSYLIKSIFICAFHIKFQLQAGIKLVCFLGGLKGKVSCYKMHNELVNFVPHIPEAHTVYHINPLYNN